MFLPYHESREVSSSFAATVPLPHELRCLQATQRFCYLLHHQAPLPYPPSSNKNKFKTQRKSERDWKREREVTSVVTSGGSGEYGEDGDRQKWIWETEKRTTSASIDGDELNIRDDCEDQSSSTLSLLRRQSSFLLWRFFFSHFEDLQTKYIKA